MKTEHRVCKAVDRKHLQLFGHIVKRNGDDIEKQIVGENVNERTCSDPYDKRWIDQIGDVTDLPLKFTVKKTELKEFLTAREQWQQSKCF